MHVEMSLDTQSESSKEALKSESGDTQSIDGSQVAAAFASIEKKSRKKEISGMQAMVVSIAAVMSIVSLYLVLVLVV